MAPDAEKLRLRNGKQIVRDALDEAATESTATHRVCRMNELSPDEVCIDGMIYTLKGFNHPGGDSIQVFGGNDVTVQYKMIHPYHTSKHLEKMKCVGKVSDYVKEYKFDTPFERELKQEVFKIVRRGREFGTLGWYSRAIAYLTLFFYLQYLWATEGSTWKLAALYGVSAAWIGLCVQHDANHGASSKRPWVNELFGMGADLIGGSKWLWLEQHWTHHTYTNHADKDPDSFGAEPMIVFNDYPLDDPRRRWHHKFNVLFYMPVLAGYWLSEVFNAQVLDLRHRGALSVGMKMESDYIKSKRKYAFLMRVMYIFINIVTPFLHHKDNWLLAFGHIMLMGVAESLTLAILFSLSHNFEHVDRDPTRSFRETGEPVCWYKSQVETSCTYGGFIAGCLTGGLNFQVEHHLFPRMSSAWYPYIAPKVREICKKHGVQYIYHPYVWQNWISTMKYMHAAGTGMHWSRDNASPLSGRM